MSIFDGYKAGDLQRLVDEYPLAWVIAADGFTASQLPLVGCYDAAGRLTGLIGHFARANPLHAALGANPQATILFSGPQAYVSPSDAGNRQWGPTWNHVHARMRVRVTIDADLTGASLDLLASHLEQGRAQPWHPAELGDRHAGMAARIIGFRAEVLEVAARFKLGQDESVQTLRHILDHHGDPQLVRWMRAFNPEREA